MHRKNKSHKSEYASQLFTTIATLMPESQQLALSRRASGIRGSLTFGRKPDPRLRIKGINGINHVIDLYVGHHLADWQTKNFAV